MSPNPTGHYRTVAFHVSRMQLTFLVTCGIVQELCILVDRVSNSLPLCLQRGSICRFSCDDLRQLLDDHFLH